MARPHCTEAEGSGYSANRGDHAEPRRFNGPQAVNTRRFERQDTETLIEREEIRTIRLRPRKTTR